MEGIRQLLRTGKRPADLNEATWKHLEVLLSAQDDSLETLVADFQWSMREAASSDLARQLQSELRSLGVASDERVAEYQFFRLFLHVTKLLCSRGTKRLTAADRDTLLRLPVPDAVENARLRVGDFFLDETDDVTAARVLAHACDQLGQILDEYRRRVLARLARERRANPFCDPARGLPAPPQPGRPTGHRGAAYCQPICNEPTSAVRLTANRSATRPPPS